MRPTRRTSSRSDGFKSGLEAAIAKQIEAVTGGPAQYETLTVQYTKPARVHRYRPDFLLPNGIIIEGKGIFEAADREKHLLLRDQRPELDVRFVFSRSLAPIYPKSKTTMAQWCDKYGFKYADKLIPISWFKEKRCVLHTS
jgi:hypothetical protein